MAASRPHLSRVEVLHPRKSAFGLTHHPGEQQVSSVVILTMINGFLHIAVLHHKQRDIWEFPGGKNDPGENALHTAVRELREETGLNHPDLLPLATLHIERPRRQGEPPALDCTIFLAKVSPHTQVRNTEAHKFHAAAFSPLHTFAGGRTPRVAIAQISESLAFVARQFADVQQVVQRTWPTTATPVGGGRCAHRPQSFLGGGHVGGHRRTGCLGTPAPGARLAQ